MMTYPASLDLFNKITTGLILLMFALVGGAALYTSFTKDFPQENQSMTAIVVFLVAVIFAITYGFRIVSYTITGESLVIGRPFKDIVYPLADLVELQHLSPTHWRGIRLFGVSGFFGFYGKFWSNKLGGYTAYGTRFNNNIFIRFKDDRKILITPDSMELWDALEKAMKKNSHIYI